MSLQTDILPQYPNLTAEYEAGDIQLYVYAEWAGVTKDLMKEILYGYEDIQANEALNLINLLNQYGEPCSYTYLFSNILSTINPNTNKGKFRTRYLKDLRTRAHTKAKNIKKLDILYKWDIKKAERTLSLLEQGQTITYALYRQTVGGLEQFLIKKKELRDYNIER